MHAQSSWTWNKKSSHPTGYALRCPGLELSLPPVFLAPNRLPAPCFALFALPSDLCVALRTVILDGGVTDGNCVRKGDRRMREKADSRRHVHDGDELSSLIGALIDGCSIVICCAPRMSGLGCGWDVVRNVNLGMRFWILRRPGSVKRSAASLHSATWASTFHIIHIIRLATTFRNRYGLLYVLYNGPI